MIRSIDRYLHYRRMKSPAKWNRILDDRIKPLVDPQGIICCGHTVLDLPGEELREWLSASGRKIDLNVPVGKKSLEFFFSSRILDLKKEDHLMDAAAGRSVYLDMVRAVYGCEKRYLMDHIYTGVKEEINGLSIVGGDISEICLPGGSLSKISCHHAFEHFQGEKDTAFIREIGRLLGPRGAGCIIPLFLSDKYAECWNITRSGGPFDRSAELVVDRTASLPGAEEDGHFARIYNEEALKRRVIDPATEVGLLPSIVTCRLDGKDVPDMTREFGSGMNTPLRALVLKKNKPAAIA